MRTLLRVAFLVAFSAVLFVVPRATPAHAATETIGGTLQVRLEGERFPVEGVHITVFRDGGEVGSAVSDADGRWEVEIPGPGSYDVALDTSTLPPDVGLTDPDRTMLTDITVSTGQHRLVVFQLGEGGTAGVSMWTRLSSLFVSGLKLGAIIALCAVGLSLVFAVTGLVNFAHAELVTIGAILAYAFHALGPRWPLAAAAIPAIAIVGVIGLSQERIVWRPLRRQGMPPLSMMVVSIGLGFALRFLVLILFGGRPRAYPDFAGQSADSFLGILVVPKALVTIAVAIVVLSAVGLFLQRTLAGTALRAVRDSTDLSESSGIDVNRVITLTWIIGASLAATGGIFFGLNESTQWDMGFRLLLLMFAAVVLGGIGTAYGAMLGGFVVGVSVEMSTLFIPSDLKAAVGLSLLILALLIKPQGLLGARERIG